MLFGELNRFLSTLVKFDYPQAQLFGGENNEISCSERMKSYSWHQHKHFTQNKHLQSFFYLYNNLQFIVKVQLFVNGGGKVCEGVCARSLGNSIDAILIVVVVATVVRI